MAHTEPFERSGTHRLIPTKYSEGSILETLPLPARALEELSELDTATNQRRLAEQGSIPSIGPGELLFGVPEAQIVNAAFSYPGPNGGRFHDTRRGAWYAGVKLETSCAEVAFHKRRFLSDSRITDVLTFEYQDFVADFSGVYSHLDPDEILTCLKPDPVPQCYEASQALAKALLYAGSNGIVFPSVRNPSGTCIACFRPALVFHPRRGKQYQLTMGAGEESWA